MFDKTLNAFTKFATLGRNELNRKRRSSLSAVYAADDTNHDRRHSATGSDDDSSGSGYFPAGNGFENAASGVGNGNSRDSATTTTKATRKSCDIDLNSDLVLQLNQGLMRRAQSMESLNISLHRKWRTIDIGNIDSSPTDTNPSTDSHNVLASASHDNNNTSVTDSENLYQDLDSVVVQAWGSKVNTTPSRDTNPHLQPRHSEDIYSDTLQRPEEGECVDFAVGDDDDDDSETEVSPEVTIPDENPYEDTEIIREILQQERHKTPAVAFLDKPSGFQDILPQETTPPEQKVKNGFRATANVDLNPHKATIDSSGQDLVGNTDRKKTRTKTGSGSSETDSDDDDDDDDSVFHDTVVKELNVIEISEQGVVSKLKTDGESDPSPCQENTQPRAALAKVTRPGRFVLKSSSDDPTNAKTIFFPAKSTFDVKGNGATHQGPQFKASDLRTRKPALKLKLSTPKPLNGRPGYSVGELHQKVKSVSPEPRPIRTQESSSIGRTANQNAAAVLQEGIVSKVKKDIEKTDDSGLRIIQGLKPRDITINQTQETNPSEEQPNVSKDAGEKSPFQLKQPDQNRRGLINIIPFKTVRPRFQSINQEVSLLSRPTLKTVKDKYPVLTKRFTLHDQDKTSLENNQGSEFSSVSVGKVVKASSPLKRKSPELKSKSESGKPATSTGTKPVPVLDLKQPVIGETDTDDIETTPKDVKVYVYPEKPPRLLKQKRAAATPVLEKPKTMDDYFEKRGMQRVGCGYDDDVEEEWDEIEEDVEVNGIRSSRYLEVLETEYTDTVALLKGNDEDDTETHTDDEVFELSDVLSRFDSIEQDVEKEEITTMESTSELQHRKPKVFPKPKPPLKPKPAFKADNVGDTVPHEKLSAGKPERTMGKCTPMKSREQKLVAHRAIAQPTDSNAARIGKMSWREDAVTTQEETSEDAEFTNGARVKDITSRLTVILSKPGKTDTEMMDNSSRGVGDQKSCKDVGNSTMVTKGPGLSLLPPGGLTLTRFDSECESIHSGTDVSSGCSEQSSGTGSIGSGSGSFPSTSPRTPPSHRAPGQKKNWSPSITPPSWDQSSITSNEEPSLSVSGSEFSVNGDGDVFSTNEDAGNANTKHGAKRDRSAVKSAIESAHKMRAQGNKPVRLTLSVPDSTDLALTGSLESPEDGTEASEENKPGRQVSQRWQKNHLKKMSAQLSTTSGVKRHLQKIQNAENLKRFSNYFANKRPSLEVLSEPIHR